MPTRLFLLIPLLLASCGGGGGPGAERPIVKELPFPTGLPHPTSLASMPAFPELSFDMPVFLTHPPDGTDRIIVVELDGRILVFPNAPATETASVFLDLSDKVSRLHTPTGLLGLAFHPDYARNGLFYVYYTPGDPLRTRVSRFRVSDDPDRADPQSETVLLEVVQPDGIHNGGMLAFGPDGMLYVGLGDGGPQHDPSSNGQNLATLLGKILRVDPDGGIPADNPFIGVPGARGEIWAYGFRNPWRFSFDRRTGGLWLGDVGQESVEEIDLVVRGGNYGWPVYEGDLPHRNLAAIPPSAFEVPVWTYPIRFSSSAVVGGYVYRGTALPSLNGAYVYADFVQSRVAALVHNGEQVISNTHIAVVPSPTSFGEDEAGELYACSVDGRVYRFEEKVPNPESVPGRLSETGLFRDTAALAPATGLIEYEINAPLWADGASKRRWLALPGTARIEFNPTEAWGFPVGTVLVKHFELETRRIETRVLVHHDLGWRGYTYRWNDEQTDAVLLADAEEAMIGGRTWRFPSRTDCLVCHTLAAGRVLGVRTRQVNRGGQLDHWNVLGLFTDVIGAARDHEAMPDADDDTAPIADRARAYLAANCSMCHRPGGPTQSTMDLRYGIPRDEMNTIGIATTIGDPGVYLVAPGAKEASALWLRPTALGEPRMPPLGSMVVDTHGVALIGAWIDDGAN